MLIRRKVKVKMIVTEKSRTDLITRLSRALSEVDSTLQSLEHQGRQFLSELKQKDVSKAEAFGRRLERRVKQQMEIRDGLKAELARVELLGLGDEYIRETLDGFVDIQVGDNLSEKLDSAEIVTKDGIVIRIQQ